MNQVLDFFNNHQVALSLLLSTIAHKGIAANQKINANDLVQLIADILIRLLKPFASKDEPQA